MKTRRRTCGGVWQMLTLLLLLASMTVGFFGWAGRAHPARPLYGVEGGREIEGGAWITSSSQLHYIGAEPCWVRMQLCNPVFVRTEEGKVVSRPVYCLRFQGGDGFNQSAWEEEDGWYYYRLPVFPDTDSAFLAGLFDTLTLNPAVCTGGEEVSVLLRVEFAPLSAHGDGAAAAFAARKG